MSKGRHRKIKFSWLNLVHFLPIVDNLEGEISHVTVRNRNLEPEEFWAVAINDVSGANQGLVGRASHGESDSLGKS